MNKATKSGLLGISMAAMTVISSLTAYAQSNNYSVTGYNENTGGYVEGSDVSRLANELRRQSLARQRLFLETKNLKKYFYFEGGFVSKEQLKKLKRGVIEGVDTYGRYDEAGNYISLRQNSILSIQNIFPRYFLSRLQKATLLPSYKFQKENYFILKNLGGSKNAKEN